MNIHVMSISDLLNLKKEYEYEVENEDNEESCAFNNYRIFVKYLPGLIDEIIRLRER